MTLTEQSTTSKPRRPRGTGSIRPKGNGWAAIWFTINSATGKREQHSKSCSTRDEAQEHLTLMLADVQRGVYRPDAKLTVRRLLEDNWLIVKEAEGLKANTINQYRYGSKLITDTIGATLVEDLTPVAAANMVKKLKAHGLSPRTIQVAVLVLKSATNWATQESMIPSNPLARYKKPGLDKSTGLKAWDLTQARAFLAAVAEDRFEACWTLLISRGLRRSELAGLKWSAVDLDAGTLQIQETRIVNNGKVVVSSPKTAAGSRPISLDARLVAKLEALRDCQLTEREIAAEAYEDLGYVMSDGLGRPMHPDSISRRFDAIVAKSGLPRITPHGLRHTAATLMLADGIQPKVVQEMLGHSDISITLGIYGHVMPGMAQRAGEQLSAALLD